MQYYVYQCDMVQGIEDLRTPLQEIIDLDKQLRGTLSGFMMPAFVIDLPGGGGKRLVSTMESYENGMATYRAPGLPGAKGSRDYHYHDPRPIPNEAWLALREHKEEALRNGQTLEQVARAREANKVSEDVFDVVRRTAPNRIFARNRSEKNTETITTHHLSSLSVKPLTASTHTPTHL
jgi:hypothetical protein